MYIYAQCIIKECHRYSLTFQQFCYFFTLRRGLYSICANGSRHVGTDGEKRGSLAQGQLDTCWSTTFKRATVYWHVFGFRVKFQIKHGCELKVWDSGQILRFN